MLYDLNGGLGNLGVDEFLSEIAKWFTDQDVDLIYVKQKVEQMGGTCRLPDLLPEGGADENDGGVSDAHLRRVLAAVEDRVKELYAIVDAVYLYSGCGMPTAMEKAYEDQLIKGQIILFAVELGKSFAAGGNND